MRFATRVLVMQLVVVVAVVVAVTAVYAVLAAQQLRAESEASALSIARTVAADPSVRQASATASADPVPLSAAVLRTGPMQTLANEVIARTGAFFVVITDNEGIRLSHPNPDQLGQVVSTSFHEALAGNEVVSWEIGTLGLSARAKVPVYALSGGDPVGQVSVGFEPASVWDDLPSLFIGIAIAGIAALAIGAIGTVLLRRRWERMTLGLQPEELVSLVQNQAAVIDGVGDGVMALDERGVVRVANSTAELLLGSDPVGTPLADLGLPEEVTAAVRASLPTDGVLWGERVLYFDSQPVRRDGRALGDVVVIRDRTDILALSGRLETVRAMTGALRVQRHEFANRLHVAAGLLDASRVEDARAFLDEQLMRGPVHYPVVRLDLVTEPLLQSFIGAKAIEAGEKGVQILIGEDTLLVGRLDEAEDVAAVLGNLIDNAVTAAADGPEPRQVVVTLYEDPSTLAFTVADSGTGIAEGVDVFGDARGRAEPDDGDDVHGHGYGLPLSRDVARRGGGDLWVAESGGPGRGGAVFAARLPGVMRPRERTQTRS